jgi:PKD repeat protein
MFIENPSFDFSKGRRETMIKKVLSLILVISIFVTSSIPFGIITCLAQTPPVAQFNYTPEKPLANETVVFDASASYDPDGTIVSYKWDFGDGSPIETLPTPLVEHTYSEPGNYTVTLVVTDNETLQDSTISVVTVIYYPTASFTYSPTTPIVGETVTFNASNSQPNGGVIVNYKWDFGDGSPITNTTTPITTHVYSAVGNYTVTLTVVDSENLTDSTIRYITLINYPVANFNYSPSYPIVNEVITFNASASNPDGGTIVEYFWDFGDGTNGTGVVVTHTYSTFGTFTVNLTVTDSEGLSNSITQEVNVRQYPEASFTYLPVNPLIGETVTFNASGSKPNGGVIVSYSWDFGDNSTGSGMIANHTFIAYGIYNVTLTVVDSEGLSNTYTISIRILISPTANFTYSPEYVAVNQSVTFDASGSFDPDGTIVTYIWDFGDGNITTTYTPIVTHIYKSANTYEVTLTVIDDDGLIDQVAKFIVVYTTVPVHDVAIISVETNSSWAYRGNLINITVIIANKGNIVEKVNVTIYYDETEIVTFRDVYLLAEENLTLTFLWNTSLVNPGGYIISVAASIVEMEENTGDNFLVNGEIIVVFIDVNLDGKIDVMDVAIVAKAYGSYPTHPNWDPRADLDGDGKIDIMDVAMVAIHFGEEL